MKPANLSRSNDGRPPSDKPPFSLPLIMSFMAFWRSNDIVAVMVNPSSVSLFCVFSCLTNGKSDTGGYCNYKNDDTDENISTSTATDTFKCIFL